MMPIEPFDYECPECGRKTNSRTGDRLHYKVEHKGSDAAYEILECPHCERDFYAPAGAADNRTFCSQTCASEHRNKKKFKKIRLKYGSNIDTQREKALERDGRECMVCDTNEENADEIQVHHIIPARSFLNKELRNDLSNLLTICASCHLEFEQKSILEQISYVEGLEQSDSEWVDRLLELYHHVSGDEVNRSALP